LQGGVEVRALIEEGRVTVGGEVVRDVDWLIFPTEDDVRVDHTLLDPQCYRHPTHTPLYAFHKPAFMSTAPFHPPRPSFPTKTDWRWLLVEGDACAVCC